MLSINLMDLIILGVKNKVKEFWKYIGLALLIALTGCGDQSNPLRNQACEDAASNHEKIVDLGLMLPIAAFEEEEADSKADNFFSCYCVEKKEHIAYDCSSDSLLVNTGATEMTMCMGEKAGIDYAEMKERCHFNKAHGTNGETGEIF